MTPESIPSMAITSFPAHGRSLKGKYQYDRADTKTQEKRIKTARATAGGDAASTDLPHHSMERKGEEQWEL